MMKNPAWRPVAALLLSFVWLGSPAKSQEQEGDQPQPAAALFQRQNILGEVFGTRPLLEKNGVSLFGTYSCEVWGNTTGGLRTGSVYTGLLEFGALTQKSMTPEVVREGGVVDS